jgi:hypothetical protein
LKSQSWYLHIGHAPKQAIISLHLTVEYVAVKRFVRQMVVQF